MIEPGGDVEAAARDVVDAAIEVHRVLGPGYLETVYEAALCHELKLRGVAFQRQSYVNVSYKGVVVGDSRFDMLVARVLVVELKAAPELSPIHTAQVLSYLKASGLSLGLLLNFGGAVMRTGIRRIILSRPRAP